MSDGRPPVIVAEALRPRRRVSSDRRFLARLLVLLLLLLSLPYLVLVIAGPPGQLYTGALFSPADYFLYIGQELHAHYGAWVFHDYYTYLRIPDLPVYYVYLLIGKLLPVVGPVPQAIGYHLARLGLAALLAVQAFRLFRELLPGRSLPRLALVLFLFTSGAGVFNLVLPGPLHLREVPFDLFYPESAAFFGMLHAPHFTAVLLFIVLFLRAFLRLMTGGGWRPLVGAALASFAVSTQHPEKVLVLAVTAAAFVAWLTWVERTGPRVSARRAVLAVLVVGAGLPFPAYGFITAHSDPVLGLILAQGIGDPVFDPALFYPFGLGLPLLFALAALPGFLRNPAPDRRGEALLWCLFVGGVFLVAVPGSEIYHRGEALQLAVAPLAARGLLRVLLPRLWGGRVFAAAVRRRLFGYSRRRLRRLSLNLAVILSAWSTLALVIAAPRAALADASEVYLTRDDQVALAWLREHSSDTDIAVSGPESAQFIAAYSGVHVAWGEHDKTPNYVAEARQLKLFFDGTTPPDEYLAPRHVTWLYLGPRERSFGRLDVSHVSGAAETFRAGDTVVYRLQR